MSTSRLKKILMLVHSQRGVNSRGWPGRVFKMLSNIRLKGVTVAVNNTAFKALMNE